MNQTPIDTRRVTDRRALRFDSFDQLRAELDRLGACSPRATGNWSPGQIYAHLAAFMDYPYDGYPEAISGPPVFIRAALRLMKRKFLNGRLPVGIRIPGVEGGTTGAEPLEPAEGLARLRRSIDRMESTVPTLSNPVLGRLTHDQWIKLNCRHAELHLSFLHPDPPPAPQPGA